MRPATMPTTPACQPSPCDQRRGAARPRPGRRLGRGPRPSCRPRPPGGRGWCCRAGWRCARASTGSSVRRRRRPRLESLMRPAALMRGPRAKPQVMAPWDVAAAAASSRAAMPGRARRAMTRRPWATRARLRPCSGMTSQTVARATRSSRSRRSGSGRVGEPAGAAEGADGGDGGQEGDGGGAAGAEAGARSRAGWG